MAFSSSKSSKFICTGSCVNFCSCRFDGTGYDAELVNLMQRDILQRKPNVHWGDIAGARLKLPVILCIPFCRLERSEKVAGRSSRPAASHARFFQRHSTAVEGRDDDWTSRNGKDDAGESSGHSTLRLDWNDFDVVGMRHHLLQCDASKFDVQMAR